MKGVWARKPKKSIFDQLDHPILIKAGTLLRFSKRYSALGKERNFVIFTWSQVFKTLLFNVVFSYPLAESRAFPTKVQLFKDLIMHNVCSKLQVI